MNKLLPATVRVIALLLLLTALPVSRVFAAASLQLSPTTSSAPQNSTFTLTLSINTDNNSVTGSDVTLQYAPAGLEFVSASNGNFFPNVIPANNGGTGQLVLHGYVTSLADAKTGAGTLATIVFKVKQSSGSSTISFVCTSGGTDTDIIASSGESLPVCASVNSVGVTYGTTVNTPTPTPGGNPTPTPLGNYAPVCTGLSSDPTQVTGTPAPFTFSCSGKDQYGILLAATFDFGDGTVDTINNNVGSPGTINTNHTYTSAGSFRATCKLRDNDNTWSLIPSECTKIVSIIPKPVTRVIYRTVSAATTTQGVPAPTPTPVLLALAYPTITPIPTAEPTQEAPVETAKSTVPWFWIIAVLAVIIGAFLTLRGRRPPQPPAGPPPSSPPIPQ